MTDVRPSGPNASRVQRGPGSHVGADGLPKLGFPDRATAKRAARRIRGNGGPELFPYPCAGTCPGWHLSGSPRRSLP